MENQNDDILHALTVHEPWASWIIHGLSFGFIDYSACRVNDHGKLGTIPERLQRRIQFHEEKRQALTGIFKRIENRSWVPGGWITKERFAIHAGKTFDPEAFGVANKVLYDMGVDFQFTNSDISRTACACMEDTSGRIIGTVVLSDIVKGSHLPFADPEKHNWILTNPRALHKPIPARGQQGFWPLTINQQEELKGVLNG